MAMVRKPFHSTDTTTKRKKNKTTKNKTKKKNELYFQIPRTEADDTDEAREEAREDSPTTSRIQDKTREDSTSISNSNTSIIFVPNRRRSPRLQEAQQVIDSHSNNKLSSNNERSREGNSSTNVPSQDNANINIEVDRPTQINKSTTATTNDNNATSTTNQKGTTDTTTTTNHKDLSKTTKDGCCMPPHWRMRYNVWWVELVRNLSQNQWEKISLQI